MDKLEADRIVLHALSTMVGAGAMWNTPPRGLGRDDRGKVGKKRPKNKKTFGKKKK